jgi:hypothetical protein
MMGSCMQMTRTSGMMVSAAQTCTIADSTEDITPVLTSEPTIRIKVAGFGGLADTLKKINIDASWIGKYIRLEASDDAVTITIDGVTSVSATNNIISTNDVTLDSIYDLAVLFVADASTLIIETSRNNA